MTIPFQKKKLIFFKIFLVFLRGESKRPVRLRMEKTLEVTKSFVPYFVNDREMN